MASSHTSRQNTQATQSLFLSPQEDALAGARHIHSPRFQLLTGRHRGIMLHVIALGLWLALLAQAFFHHSWGFWATGIAYTLYDTALLGFIAWHTWALRHPRAANDPILQECLADAPSLGVLVASYNEATVLPATLRSLHAQCLTGDQIVIADDGSTDGTESVLIREFEFFATDHPMCWQSRLYPHMFWLRLPHRGKAAALNAALQFTSCECVLTLDADTQVKPNALLAIRHAFFAQKDLVAAGGILIPYTDRHVSAKWFGHFQRYEYLRNFLSRYAWSQLNSLLLISGAFGAFRRDALLTVGGFDADCLVEDYELVHRLQRYAKAHEKKWTFNVIPEAQAYTEAPSNVVSFLRQRRRWFAGFLQTQYWNRDMVGNPRFGALGMLMLPIKALDSFQPLYGLSAFALLMLLIITGRLEVLLPVLGIIVGKTVLDCSFNLWSLRLYRRWTGLHRETDANLAAFTALAEPFSFQLLRHLGALLGWWQWLRGRHSWGVQHRHTPSTI